MTIRPDITAITLGVRDVEASRAFYVDGLGFRQVLHTPGDISFVQCGSGLLLALWDVTQMPSEYGDVAHGPAAPPLSLGHNVERPEQVEELYAAPLADGRGECLRGRPRRLPLGLRAQPELHH